MVEFIGRTLLADPLELGSEAIVIPCPEEGEVLTGVNRFRNGLEGMMMKHRQVDDDQGRRSRKREKREKFDYW